VLLHRTGLTYSTATATQGYILIIPCAGSNAYLVNHAGETVHRWMTGPGFTNWGYLLPNGNLFVNERCSNREGVALTGSGLLREYDWDGNRVSEHLDPWQHHDARRLPNGNSVYPAYTSLSDEEQSQIPGGIVNSESEVFSQ